MKKMDDYTKISLKALDVDLIAWPVAFILTFLIVTYANDLAQYIRIFFCECMSSGRRYFGI